MIKKFIAAILVSLCFMCSPNTINNDIVACRIGLPSTSCNDSVTQTCSNYKNNNQQRIIAIGDIHGSYESFLKILFSTNLTVDQTQCEWHSAVAPTLLIQMGDLTDRGLYSLECFKCLAHLQATSSLHNSTVIRLVGNHDLWWLEGHFHSTEESSDRIAEHVMALRRDVLAGKVQGAYFHSLHNESILFSHSGFRQEYLDYLNKQSTLKSIASLNAKNDNSNSNNNNNNNQSTNISSSSSSLPIEKLLAQHVNSVLVERLSKCMARQNQQKMSLLNYQCEFEEKIFQAGPDRGGDDIGGPFWTDFSVLKADAEAHAASRMPRQPFIANSNTMIQVVGHTPPPFDRYTGQLKNTHIRTSKNMQAVCVDGGMPFGTYSFLEIRSHDDNHFIAHEYQQPVPPKNNNNNHDNDGSDGEWVQRDLTAMECQ